MAAPLKPPPDSGNSRERAVEAGWRDDPGPPYKTHWEHLLKQRRRNRWVNFSWISPAPLLASANDKIAKGLDDLINDLRPRWVAAQRAAGRLDDGLRVIAHEGKGTLSFLILGDPGEQDPSQYAVVKPLLEVGAGTDFMLIDSDVIYPAGDINDYIDGFFLPYEAYPSPIYAIPGNHDWYDGLNGFMFHFCGAEALPPASYRAGSYTWNQRLARALWRKPSPPKLPELLYERRSRAQLEPKGAGASWQPAQPGPYFAIETEPLLIVCIDTGITGKLDREQGDWLRDISRDRRPKLLVTGKPIYVDGEYHPGEIDWGPESYPGLREEIQRVGPKGNIERLETVDDIVRAPEHRYVAAIGGDVHNYQRYSVLINDEGTAKNGPPPGLDTPDDSVRRLEYVVAGGGGAYLSATHRFGRVNLDPRVPPEKRKHKPVPKNVAPIDEGAFFCYPLRGDSLARFVRRFTPGFAVALGVAVLILALFVGGFLWPGDGWENLRTTGNALAVWAVPVALGTVVLTAAAIVGGVVLSRKVVPVGFRTLAATTLVAAAGVLFVFLGNLIGDAWDAWIWRLAVSSLIAVVLPVLGVVAYYLLRDFIPQSVRAGVGIAIGLALFLTWLGSELEVEAEVVPLLISIGLALLWLIVLGLARLQELPEDPDRREERATKYRVLAGQTIPVIVGTAGVVIALVELQDTGRLVTGVLTAFVATLFILTVLLLLTGWYGFRAIRWWRRPDIDPDMTARWLANELKMEPVHTSARDATPDNRTKRLAEMTYRSVPYRFLMSELAEATTPPFFKSFLRLDVTPDELKITAFGVTGWLEDEKSPTVEDEVTIPL